MIANLSQSPRVILISAHGRAMDVNVTGVPLLCESTALSGLSPRLTIWSRTTSHKIPVHDEVFFETWSSLAGFGASSVAAFSICPFLSERGDVGLMDEELIPHFVWLKQILSFNRCAKRIAVGRQAARLLKRSGWPCYLVDPESPDESIQAQIGTALGYREATASDAT